MVSLPNYLTLIRGKSPINKRVTISNGKPLKTAKAAIYEAEATTVAVSDALEMKSLQEFISKDTHLALISGFAKGTKPGDKYRITTEAAIKAINPRYRRGFVDTDKGPVITRTKANFRPSTWANLDRDFDAECPERLATMSDGEYVSALSKILPDLEMAGICKVPSTSGRVLFKGEPISTSGGARYWFQFSNSPKQDIGQQLLTAAIDEDLAYLKKSSSGSTLARTIFDVAVFSPERIVFDGCPSVSKQPDLTISEPVITAWPGGEIDLASVKQFSLTEQAARQRRLRGGDDAAINVADGKWRKKEGTDWKQRKFYSSSSEEWTEIQGALNLDTVIETKAGPITPRQFYRMGIPKLRAQHPFRANADSWGSFLKLERGFPILFDIVDRERHVLTTGDQFALLTGALA